MAKCLRSNKKSLRFVTSRVRGRKLTVPPQGIAPVQSGILVSLLLPLAIGIIMLGLGLSLTLDDFRRVARYPRAVLIGLLLQSVLLPGVAFAIAIALKLSPPLAIGLMLLAAAPGGPTANIYSHLARGDVALNITLTAINSLMCLLTLPIIMNLSLCLLYTSPSPRDS